MDKSEELFRVKRFEVAKNPVAYGRLEQFRQQVKKFQEEYPEVLGATVFGSMIKGEKATAESDIDGFLYIDAEVNDKEKLKNRSKLEIDYKTNLLKRLGLSPEEEEKYFHDFQPKILSNEILDQDINSFVTIYKKRQEYRMIAEEYEEENDVVLMLADREKLFGQMPGIPSVDESIAGMFHARVGHGIQKYRRLFLEKLMTLEDPKMAREIWNGIYAQLSTYEGRGSEGKIVRLPATLEEALQIYHPELLRSTIEEQDQRKIAALRAGIFAQFGRDSLGDE